MLTARCLHFDLQQNSRSAVSSVEDRDPHSSFQHQLLIGASFSFRTAIPAIHDLCLHTLHITTHAAYSLLSASTNDNLEVDPSDWLHKMTNQIT